MWLKSLRMVTATSVSTSLSGWWPGYTQTEKNQVKKKNKFYIKIYCLYWFLMKDRELCKMWFNVWMNNQNQSPKASIVSSQFFFISQGVQRLRHRGRSPRGVPSFWQRGGWIYYNSGFSRGFCSCDDENWSWWYLTIVPSSIPNIPIMPITSIVSINQHAVDHHKVMQTFGDILSIAETEVSIFYNQLQFQTYKKSGNWLIKPKDVIAKSMLKYKKIVSCHHLSQEMNSQADIDGDGNVNYEEFVAMLFRGVSPCLMVGIKYIHLKSWSIIIAMQLNSLFQPFGSSKGSEDIVRTQVNIGKRKSVSEVFYHSF